jgi:drug/metabolite transporter (DMT)-like permease
VNTATAPATAAAVSPGRATFMLVLVAALWGLSMPLMKSWQEAAVGSCPGGDALATLTLIALRMFLALVVLGLFQPRLVVAPTRREHAVGLGLGLTFFLGLALQVWGLAETTPARSGFITSLSSAWVPLLGFVFLRTAVARLTLVGLVLGVAGTAGMGLDLNEGWCFGAGEARTLGGSLLFAVQLLLLDRFGRSVRSAYVTVAFLGVTAALGGGLAVAVAATGPGIEAWVGWMADMFTRPVVLRDFLLLMLLPTVVGFHLMNTYQPHVSAGRAAIIYLLEPVFGAVFSVLWGQDAVTGRLLLAGSLILGGNLLIEAPSWLRARGSRSLPGQLNEPACRPAVV